jgi:predicted TIM-barrel fold metal-dependent hydrolase
MLGPMLTRRNLLIFSASALHGAPARPNGLLIDTHVHLFDPERFPYSPHATYKPPPAPLEEYMKFVREIRLDHTVIVHPEPYQDDHRYLEYCFTHEPSPGFFKGTCLFDPLRPDTASRMAELTKRWPGRIVALRIHENRKAGEPAWPVAKPIRERDLDDPAMKNTWRAAAGLGLAIQMHFTPNHAPAIAKLATQFRDMPVVLDHLARSGQGTPAEYDNVLALARLPRVIMKFSGWGYSSKEPVPHKDIAPLVKRTFDAFGPDRMIWGGLGHDAKQFKSAVDTFEAAFAFASAEDKAKIRGLTAKKLFRFE